MVVWIVIIINDINRIYYVIGIFLSGLFKLIFLTFIVIYELGIIIYFVVIREEIGRSNLLKVYS